MNRWLFALLLLCSAGVAMAQRTSDKVNISAVELSPGGDLKEVTVSLSGSSIKYSAYQMEIFLPNGYEFVEKSKKLVTMSKPSLYPYTEGEEDDEGNTQKEYTHTIAAALQSGGSLKVSCLSLENESFTKTSGNLFKFYVKASSYAKAGFADVKITDCRLIVGDNAAQYDTDDQTISDKLSASSNCSLPFSITAKKKWSTRVFPFSMKEIPEGLSVYTYKEQDNENVYLTKQNSIEAYTPYIISTEEDMNVTLTGTASAEEYEKCVIDGICGEIDPNGQPYKTTLLGAVKNQIVTSGYILQSQGGGECMFYPIVNNESFSIPTGKCWIYNPDASAKELKFIISDDADGIETTQLQAEVPEAVYDLQGRRTRASQHGVYIIDGKKVIK